MPPNKYFATLPDKELVAELDKRRNAYYEYLQNSGLLKRMFRMYKAWYGFADRNAANSMEVSAGGDEGELSFVKVNHIRNIGTHYVNFISADKPSPQPVATNTDGRSLQQTILADGVLEYYTRQLQILRLRRQIIKNMLITGEGGALVTWDAKAGKPHARDMQTGVMGFEGDARLTVLSAIDVIRDVAKNSREDCPWVMTRTWMNKFELAEIYPELAEQITSVSADADNGQFRFHMKGAADSMTDEIPVYEFWHKKSAALPEGKHCIFLNGEVFLHCGPLAYREIPLISLTVEDMLQTVSADSPMWQLLGLQELNDLLVSAIATNNLTNGVQNIKITKGHGLDISQMAGGMSLWEVNPGTEVEGMNLTKTAPETFNAANMVVQAMEKISGINETVRGAPSANLRSGDSLALMQSQVTSYTSGDQQLVADFDGRLYTTLLHIIQDFCSIPRKAMLLGKSQRYALQSFSGKDLEQIDSCIVEAGNAMAKTVAQRMQLATMLIQNKMVTTPEQLLTYVNTGKWETLVEASQKQLINIRRENEDLQNGMDANALFTDPHVTHILEHSAELSDPESRRDHAYVNRVGAHIQQHLELLRTTDPVLLGLLGQPIPPPPAPPAPGAPGAPPDGPQGPGGPPGGPPPPMPPEGPQGPTDVPQKSLPKTPDGQPINVPGVS